jgi:hypothetical protein
MKRGLIKKLLWKYQSKLCKRRKSVTFILITPCKKFASIDKSPSICSPLSYQLVRLATYFLTFFQLKFTCILLAYNLLFEDFYFNSKHNVRVFVDRLHSFKIKYNTTKNYNKRKKINWMFRLIQPFWDKVYYLMHYLKREFLKLCRTLQGPFTLNNWWNNMEKSVHASIFFSLRPQLGIFFRQRLNLVFIIVDKKVKRINCYILDRYKFKMWKISDKIVSRIKLITKNGWQKQELTWAILKKTTLKFLCCFLKTSYT